MKNKRNTAGLLFATLVLLIPIAQALTYNQQSDTIAQTISNIPNFFVDNNTSDMDSSVDKGTHSNFTAEQYGPNSIYDTLTEADTGGTETGYKVQQGYAEIGATSTTLDVTLDYIPDLSRAFVLVHYYYGQPNSNINHEADEGMGNAYLWDDSGTTKIRFTRGAQHGIVTRWEWQVIQCFNQEFKVYRGSQSYSGTNTLYTPNIGATVNGSNCLAWVNGVTSDKTGRGRIREHYFTADESAGSQTTLNIRRYAPAGGPSGTLRWIVVEFDVGGHFNGAIDSGEVSVSNQYESSPATFTITGCNKSRSILLAQTRTSGDDGLNTHATAVRMVSDTQGEAYTHDNNFLRVVRWYAIDFGPDVGSRQEGRIDNTANPNWNSEDITLSPNITVNRTISYVSFTSDGDGTLFPRPTCYYWLSAPDNLAIRRPRYGQEGNIEWQILELPYSANTTNYELDLEVQWTNIDYHEQNEELCIYAGTTGSENIKVDVWTGSEWVNLFTDLNSGWNNVTVTSYHTSSTFTIRFKGGTESTDATQDYWTIDTTLLHTWT